jgi:RHS repeat-associated protein
MADLSTGSLAYYQRMYDPLTGTWTAQDAWRGLLARPQTLNGFGFVFGNPLSWTDLLGFAGMLIDGQWGSKGAYREGQKAREKVIPRTQAGYPAKWRPGRYPGRTPDVRKKESAYRLCDVLSFREGDCSNAWPPRECCRLHKLWR